MGMKTTGGLQVPVRGAEMWPLSVEAYHALGEAGLMPKQTELLCGFIYHKMSKSPLHSYLLQILQESFQKQIPVGLLVRTEQPITCADSEPEPGLAVVAGKASDYREAHPRTAELVVEICVTSTEYDRSKLRAYASAGVKECWLVLAGQKQIEVYTQPQIEQFGHFQLSGPGGNLTSISVPQLTIDLGAFFGA